ncbi:hypothetical protein GCM10009550_27130 [Actinocorallia libanotica]|uniref:Uncharacterized protein n=1 Tax=Actinocorallia libanotica TaxID=46162 RepID=A0ABN1R1Y4_9ACTN
MPLVETPAAACAARCAGLCGTPPYRARNPARSGPTGLCGDGKTGLRKGEREKGRRSGVRSSAPSGRAWIS